MENKPLDHWMSNFQGNSEEIRIKCLPDEFRNINVHELKEKHSFMITLELPGKPVYSTCKNIVIDREDEKEINIFDSTTCKLNDLQVNGKIVEEENTYYQCFHCGLKCENVSQFQEHYNVHTISKPFEKCEIGYECISSIKSLHICKVCDFKSLKEDSFKDHLLKFHQEIPPFICLECYFVTRIRNSFDEHLLTHATKSFFKCYFCTFRCLKKRYLKEHLNLAHSSYKPFDCKKCNFKGKRRIDLLKHERTHSLLKPYKCSQCAFKSKSPQYLKTHMLSHNNLKPFHCAVCDCQFTTKYLLKDHFINYHTHERPFKCSVCFISFKRNSSLKRHMLTHTESRPFECNFCEYTCSRKDNLKSHVNAIHSDIKPHSCKSCSFTCKFRTTLKNHLNAHSLANPFVCNKCGYRFKSDVKLKRHNSSHILGENKTCPYCSKKAKTKVDLQIHLESCRKDGRIISCSDCSFSCKRKTTLNKHFEQQHSDPSLPYHCPHCSLKFKQENYFKLHVRSHDSSKKFYCSQCSFTTKVKAILMKHLSYHDFKWSFDSNKPCHVNILINGSDSDVMPKIKIEPECKLNIEDTKIVKINCLEDEGKSGKIENVPPVSVLQNSCTIKSEDDIIISGEEIYNSEQYDIIQEMYSKHKCPVCEERFNTKLDLKEHLTLQHNDYRQYKCDKCEQKFKIKANLKQHLVVHSDLKPYQCTICDYKSKLPETLRRHYVTHSTEKPFQCPLCKYRCKLKEKLKRHMIVHSTERPFHCLQCAYACKTRELLKKHAAVHTRDREKIIS